MFKSDINYSKLKTNLRLAENRLKLLEKKKTEQTQKSRKEIADYITAGKYERARVRVEQIIREDYLIEALEVIELYCDLIVSRFGLLQQNKTVDPSLMESISSLIWCSAMLESDIPELKVISDLFAQKYGKKYAEACQAGTIDTVSAKLKHKLGLQPPPKILVEKYLIEISKNYSVQYEPDLQVLREHERSTGVDSMLFGNMNDLDNKDVQRPTGFIGYPQPLLPPFAPPVFPVEPCPYPAVNVGQNFSSPDKMNVPPPSVQPDDEKISNISQKNYSNPLDKETKPAPKFEPTNKFIPPPANNFSMPELPAVPTHTPIGEPGRGPLNDSDEIDFDELAKRFDELKKKK